MELHELHVDASRTRAVRHRDPVAARSGRVRRVKKQTAEAAGREYRLLGDPAFHLARLFRQATGHSLHGYRTELRLRSALDHLASSSCDLVTLALSLGYSSHSHFTRVFRHAFGVTPSSVRGRLTAGRARELVTRLCTARH